MSKKLSDRFSRFDTIPECDSQPPSQPPSHVAVAITLNAKASSLKTMHWITKLLASFLMVSTCCITVQSLGKMRTTTRAGSRCENMVFVFRLDALALSVIATATWLAGWLGGWVAGCHTPVLYQNG